jgi:hypothetical protein
MHIFGLTNGACFVSEKNMSSDASDAWVVKEW